MRFAKSSLLILLPVMLSALMVFWLSEGAPQFKREEQVWQNILQIVADILSAAGL